MEIKKEEIIYNTKLNNKLNYDNSFMGNHNISNNTTLEMTLNNISFENQEKKDIKEKKEEKEKKYIKKEPLISEELKEQIEEMVDKEFEMQYKELNNYYEEIIEELLNEQEIVFNKNEILKQKYNALVKYIKNYCRKGNIDYESLISD